MASKPFVDRRRGTWWMKYKPDPAGDWVKVRLGAHGSPFPPSKPPKKPPQHIADRAAEFVEIEWRAGQGLPTAQARETGLAGYVAAYLENYERTRKAGSVRNLRRLAGYFLAFAESKGVRSVQGVSKQLVREYLADRVKRVTPNTLKTERAYLAAIWNQAVTDELIAASPWARVKAPGKPDPSDPVFWTSDQVDALVAACRPERLRDLVLVMVGTGIRVRAALAMRWGWVDWGRGVVRVPKEADKAGKGYEVPITATARDVLQRLDTGAKSALVWPGPGGKPWSYEWTRTLFMEAVEKSGVPRGTLHDLRHTFGRSLAAAAPINVVQASLGHSSLAMTQRYTSVGGGAGVGIMEDFRVGSAGQDPVAK